MNPIITWWRRRRDRRVLLVLWAVQALPGAGGFQLHRLTGLPFGALYATLAALEAAGQLVSEREVSLEPSERPPRRVYAITDAGRRRAATLTQSLSSQWYLPPVNGEAQP